MPNNKAPLACSRLSASKAAVEPLLLYKSPVRWVRASFSGSPAVHIRPQSLGDFFEARRAPRSFEAFLVNVANGQIASTSTAKKKCPRGIGFFSPVTRSIPHTSSPKGP